MSSRPGVVVSAFAAADGGVSPNRYIPTITVEIRAFWPPKATDAEIDAVLLDALIRAKASINERRGN